MKIKEKVLKDLFMIFPMPEADSLKYIRKSANKILEDKYISVVNFEKAIDLTLAERNKEVDKVIDDELSLKRKKEDKLILEYRPISHISNSKTQALQREMKEIKIEIKLLEELKQKLGGTN